MEGLGGDPEVLGSAPLVGPGGAPPTPVDPRLWAGMSPEQQTHLFNLLRGMTSAPEGTPFYSMDQKPVGPQLQLPPSERPAEAISF